MNEKKSENWREVEPKNTSTTSKNKDRKIVENCGEKSHATHAENEGKSKPGEGGPLFELLKIHRISKSERMERTWADGEKRRENPRDTPQVPEGTVADFVHTLTFCPSKSRRLVQHLTVWRLGSNWTLKAIDNCGKGLDIRVRHPLPFPLLKLTRQTANR